MRLPALEARSRLILYTFERAGVVSLADIPLQGIQLINQAEYRHFNIFHNCN